MPEAVQRTMRPHVLTGLFVRPKTNDKTHSSSLDRRCARVCDAEMLARYISLARNAWNAIGASAGTLFTACQFYFLGMSFSSDHYGANAECQTAGYNSLASIYRAAENADTASLCANGGAATCFIGQLQSSTGAAWEWHDTFAISYTNWNLQPDNSVTGDVQSVIAATGSWVGKRSGHIHDSAICQLCAK